MRQVSFCHKETGLFNGAFYTLSDDDAVALNTPPDHVPVDGHHDQNTKRFDHASGKVVDFAQPPPTNEQQAKESRRMALMAIRQIESGQDRALREAVLGIAGGSERLLEIEARIAELRKEL